MFRFFFCCLILSGISSIGACTCLDLETAYLRVLACHPALEVTKTEIAIREAERNQVSLRPNPLFSVEAENLGVSDPQKAEPPLTTYSVSQLLELGGKRAARRNVAIAEAQVAAWEAMIAYQDLRSQVMEVFIDIRFHEEKAALAQKKVLLTQEILESVETLVRMGKLSPIQQKQASIARGFAEMVSQKALSELMQAKQRLSIMWGNPCPDFDTVAFDLHSLPSLPDLCLISSAILQTADYQKSQYQIFIASQNLKLQKANSIPDITVNVGYRVYENSHEHGWVVGAAIPLPVFDKNQGNIQKASLEMSQAQYQLDNLVRQWQEKAASLYEQARSACEKAEMISQKILSEAKETLEMIEKGYEKGKLSYIDLLEARKSLFEIEENHIDALNEYHVTKAQLDRLRGEYCHL